MYRLLSEPLAKFTLWVTVHKPRVFGAESRLRVAQDAVVQNAMFNVMSGDVTLVGKVFFGHNVSLLTGTYDYERLGSSRMSAFPLEGRDILVKEALGWRLT